MIDFIKLQAMMHEKFGFNAPKNPLILDDEFFKMRLNFLLEELSELANAAGFTGGVSEFTGKFQYQKEEFPEYNKEGILDALVDLQVVLLGTAHLLGFFNQSPTIQVPGAFDDRIVENTNPSYSIFEEAYNRVWQANMKKVACQSAEESKRGYKIDLKKPVGWKPPVLTDLVKGLFSYCVDCKCELEVPHAPQSDHKCPACFAASNH